MGLTLPGKVVDLAQLFARWAFMSWQKAVQARKQNTV